MKASAATHIIPGTVKRCSAEAEGHLCVSFERGEINKRSVYAVSHAQGNNIGRGRRSGKQSNRWKGAMGGRRGGLIINGSQAGSAGVQATTTQTVQKQKDAKTVCVCLSVTPVIIYYVAVIYSK